MRKIVASWLALLLILTMVSPTSLAVQANQQQAIQANEAIELEVSQSLLSLTEIRTVDVKVDFGETVNLENLKWEFGGKDFADWKKWNSEAKEYSGESFIQVIEEPHYVGNTTTIQATVEFHLPYDTTNLAPRAIRVLYPELIGNYELALINADTGVKASTNVKLNVYDEYLAYEEIKPAIDQIFGEASDSNNRYLEYKKLGESVEGRDIHFVVLAKDEAVVNKYLDETLPLALENPEELLKKLEDGTIGDYQVPIWFNNIHPDEVEGVDAQVELLKKFALENEVTFQTTDENGTESTVTLNVEDILDDVIFLFNFTHNPDGRVANTRANANGFDLNRDNAYQTQVETIAVNEEIAKWTPLSFLDFHGYVNGFLIEPATPPHNPNFEYDLLINSMLDQAHAMGRAGVANSDLDSYFIPALDWGSGWDDMTPAYTAIFSMLHGSLGHTIEVPTLSQDSLYATVHAGLGATNYVVDQKDQLFKNQLKIFKRGVNGEDDRSVDQYYVNQAGEEIGRIRGNHENFFPEYYVIPNDIEDQKNILEANKMVDYLVRNGIKVEQTTELVTVDGATYPVGTYIVPMNQAKRGLANAMLYPGDDASDWDAMYDPIVVNFPALRGFDAEEVRVKDAFTAKTKDVQAANVPTSQIDSSTEQQVLTNSNNDVIKIVNDLLAKGKVVQSVQEGSAGINQGDFVVETKDLAPYASGYVFDALPLTKEIKTVELTQPKVAVIGSKQSKVVVEELGFELVDQEQADVLIDDAGALNVDQLAGKAYIGIGGRALKAVKDGNVLDGFDYQTTQLSHEGLVKASVNNHLLTSGYQEDELLYITTGSWISAVPEQAEVLATISADEDFYVAGWWPGHDGAKGETLGFTQNLDQATVTLFANDLAFRAHTQHSYRLLANSIYASAQAEKAPTTPTFSDVNEKYWAKKEIEALYADGVISGYPDGTFQPRNQLNRGQAAELLTNALKLEVSSELTEAPFSDLTVKSYYAPFAKAVKEASIFTGKFDETFGAGDLLTREQMATVLVRAFHLENTGEKVTMTDVERISNDHQENVEILAQHGITTVSEYRPKEAVSRAQFAAFLYRALEQE